MGIFRNRPTVGLADNFNDAAVGSTRRSWYGDAFHIALGGANNTPFADEGSYFVATNPTLATGVAGHAAPVVADTDTKALLHLYNGGQRFITPDYLFLEVTAAGTGGTISYAVVYVDNKGTTALSSGGSAITPVNTRSDQPTATAAAVTFGAAVTALTASKKVGQQILREVIAVVQDTVILKFGSANSGVHSSLTTAGTATNHLVVPFAPVVIAPGGNLNIAIISPSQSAAKSYQFEFGYWER